jgi:hypothetical protein
LPASDTTSIVRLNLNRQFPLQHLASPQAIQQRVVRRYPYFADTMQQVEVRFPANLHKIRALTFAYSGTLDKGLVTDHVMVFSGHSNWLPFRPGKEYELVTYTLAVSVPPAYQVRRSEYGIRLFSGTREKGSAHAYPVRALGTAYQFRS